MIGLVLKRPLLTEKTLSLARAGFYTFEVQAEATKDNIRKALKDHYHVDAILVRTMSIKGRSHRVGRIRKVLALPKIKKAVVRLKKDQKIDVFEIGT